MLPPRDRHQDVRLCVESTDASEPWAVRGTRFPMLASLAFLLIGMAGANLRSTAAGSVAPERVEPASKGPMVITDEARQFWSFRPLTTPVAPKPKDPAWCRTPIDDFVLAKLEAKALVPNPPADPRKLIRRAYLDVIGIPPTPEEIQLFLRDASPQAYERLIDHLLASPHYGERWGRHWLDLARFAESHGFEHDTDRPTAYHFRDFVIQALNLDMPYDRFVQWQIAGDEIQPESPLAMMATGFLAAGVHATQITANQAEKERYDELDDMAATIGTSMLGLTIGCARCHDHKFDPIPTADYYRLLSSFTTAVRSEIGLDFSVERTLQAAADFEREHARFVTALESFERQELPHRLEQWLVKGGKPPEAKWLILESAVVKSQGGATFTNLSDGSFLASGKNPKFDTYVVTARTTLKGIVAVRVEALSDSSMVKNGPGRANNGNFALSDFRLAVAPLDGQAEGTSIKLIRPKASFEQKGLPIASAIDDDAKTGWAIDPQFGKDHAAVFEFETPVGFEKGTALTFALKFETNDGHNIGRLRLSITTEPNPSPLDGEIGFHDLLLEIRRILTIASEQRTDAQRAALLRWYRSIDPEWQRLSKSVEEHSKKKPKPNLTKVLITSEGVPALRLNTQGPDFYEKTYFLKRGDPNQKQGEVSPGFLQVLMRGADSEKHWQQDPPANCRSSYRRTALAKWITDVDHGAGQLLARVIVNRLWQHHFGRGIVATPNDFGSQGERPTHPELLDWLASELIRNGWRLKPLHKQIMMSAAYRQSAEWNELSANADPDNRLFWRQPPRRLEGEVIRDAMLAVSGTLDHRMFGPGTLDEGQHRRSIYFTIKRSKLIPILLLFDAPEPLQSSGSRATTTVAPQALLLMNNSHVRSWAREFAKRVLPTASKSLTGGVELSYLIALGRPPSSDELNDTLGFLQQFNPNDGRENLELALTSFCQTLLCLNEFVYTE